MQALLTAALFASAISATPTHELNARAASKPIGSCPGYTASNVVKTSYNGLSADLKLAGAACNTYGKDLQNLRLEVTYETDSRLHVMIEDKDRQVYQVPVEVLPRPTASSYSNGKSQLQFVYKAKPFGFTISRGKEVLFDTTGTQLVFQDQYVRLRSALPENPNLYGFGEHSDPFHLNTTDYSRTLWSKDAYGIPENTNLYGNHPVYFQHSDKGTTHGVFMLNSNGMDFKVNKTSEGQYLEYNMLGGVVDLYFLAGPGPQDVARQYSEVVGKSAMMPYWGFGFHQCRYGYRDVFNVAEVVSNYSIAKIPLETMWTDIDYMDRRKVFTLDPERFPLHQMRELVTHLHNHNQHYVVMVDPAVAYLNKSAYENGLEDDIFLRYDNGTIYNGVVWPGVTVFPDWFHPNASRFWISEFANFFDKNNGLDIDALWIDMNEASNFACDFPCINPQAWADKSQFPPTPPPVRSNPRPLPGFPADFQPGAPIKARTIEAHGEVSGVVERRTIVNKRAVGDMKGLPGRELITPKYAINNIGGVNSEGGLSNHTIRTDLTHFNGLKEYDVHNLYGSMMSSLSRDALASRRPGLRPLIITRSTFAGAGAKVGKWLGDNFSDMMHYKQSISGLLQFASIYQIPMVGSDICGFVADTNDKLCARWAMLGAFSPFMRNHNADGSRSQEFYIWPLVAKAAQKAIDMRYRLLDYIYTAMHEQSISGTPLVSPMFYLYPKDKATFAIEYQYFYGPSILVSPVTADNSTSVDFYLPKDKFYDLWTLEPIVGKGARVSLENVDYTSIPAHIKSGSIIPMRSSGAMTTTELRAKPFELIIAPDASGSASGSLYLDDGVSIKQTSTSLITFTYKKGSLTIGGNFGYFNTHADSVTKITFLDTKAKTVKINGRKISTCKSSGGNFIVNTSIKLDVKATIQLL